MKNLSITELKECFLYEKETGKLIWAVGQLKGKCAGSPTSEGYISICVKGNRLYAHRIVFAIHNNRFPMEIIDHINRNRTDNRIENLREASRWQNTLNTNRVKRKTGVRGVLETKSGKYYSEIVFNKKKIYLGTFEKIEDAKNAYIAAAIKYHGNYSEEYFNK